MSLYNFVYNLQRKPKKTKERILVGFLAASFIVLVTIWFFMFKNQLSQTRTALTPTSAKLLGEDQGLLSPLATLLQGFRGFKNDITQKIGEYRSNNAPATDSENIRPVYELRVE